MNARVGRSDNERFLEQFGYVIVASQLLNEHNAPSYTSAADILANSHPVDLPSISTTFGLQGAVVTASTSFSIAWLLHWSRSRTGSGLNPRKVGVLLVLVPVIGVLFYAFAKRQWLKYLRHQAVEAAVSFIGNAQGFDSAASASVVFIQEVELVSRGYRMYVHFYEFGVTQCTDYATEVPLCRRSRGSRIRSKPAAACDYVAPCPNASIQC